MAQLSPSLFDSLSSWNILLWLYVLNRSISFCIIDDFPNRLCFLRKNLGALKLFLSTFRRKLMKLYNLLILVLQQIFFAKWKLLSKSQIKLLQPPCHRQRLVENFVNWNKTIILWKTFKIFANGIPALINQIRTTF